MQHSIDRSYVSIPFYGTFLDRFLKSRYAKIASSAVHVMNMPCTPPMKKKCEIALLIIEIAIKNIGPPLVSSNNPN